MLEPTKYTEVRRILQRYVVEVVEKWQLCPWARLGDELAIELLLGEPPLEVWVAALDHAFSSPATRVAMLVAPELVTDFSAFHTLRNQVSDQRPAYGIAEFHPTAKLDLATPARLVPWLRRSPDPLLQCVPLALLDSVRSKSIPDRMQQAQIIQGLAKPPRDVAAQLAETNHATVAEHRAEIEAALDDIARDRDAAYARVSINACR